MQQNGYSTIMETSKENGYHATAYPYDSGKLPLKLVMDPRGQVQDLATLRQHGITLDNSGMLSPDRCAELVSALHAPKGKGKNFLIFSIQFYKGYPLEKKLSFAEMNFHDRKNLSFSEMIF